MRFEHQAAVVTGAGNGISRAAAVRLAPEGAKVALVDRDVDGLAQTAALLASEADNCAYPLDVADEAAVEECVDKVLARFGRIDVLCNNAGVAGSRRLATDQDAEEWRRIMAVNLYGADKFHQNRRVRFGRMAGAG